MAGFGNTCPAIASLPQIATEMISDGHKFNNLLGAYPQTLLS